MTDTPAPLETDIVERLHAAYHLVCQLEDGDHVPYSVISTILDTKAEIERLRGIVERLRSTSND